MLPMSMLITFALARTETSIEGICIHQPTGDLAQIKRFKQEPSNDVVDRGPANVPGL